MRRSALTLASAQACRAVSLPAHARSAPVRAGALEGWRQRNAVLDSIFYDIGNVTLEEAKDIGPLLAAEGALLIVPPSGQGRLALCLDLHGFVACGGEQVRSLVVAGVGSSALGAAAFARNVADATGSAVAAVVSGYGLADVITEGLGGFFWFGTLNSLRHLFEELDLRTEANHRAEAAISDYIAPSFMPESRDLRVLFALLKCPRFRFHLLVGHSKGNLILSEALYKLERTDEARLARLAETTRIVTISARIAMPMAFRGVIDIIGGWDWLGSLNSRPGIRPDIVVPGAWHHTNTELPGHVPVTELMRRVL